MCGPPSCEKKKARQKSPKKSFGGALKSIEPTLPAMAIYYTYLTIRTGDLWEDAHDRADQVKKSHGVKRQAATTVVML
jgi:hypothetical protein